MIRIANIDDLKTLSCYARIVAREMKESGIDQWSSTYPDYPDFDKDLNRNALYVIENEYGIIGSITLLPENDPYYRLLSWKVSHALVIHRLMILPAFRRNQMGKSLFQFAIDQAKAGQYDGLKVDTHPDNYRMQGLIISMGFHEVGYMPGFNRIGYELKF